MATRALPYFLASCATHAALRPNSCQPASAQARSERQCVRLFCSDGEKRLLACDELHSRCWGDTITAQPCEKQRNGLPYAVPTKHHYNSLQDKDCQGIVVACRSDDSRSMLARRLSSEDRDVDGSGGETAFISTHLCAWSRECATDEDDNSSGGEMASISVTSVRGCRLP